MPCYFNVSSVLQYISILYYVFLVRLVYRMYIMSHFICKGTMSKIKIRFFYNINEVEFIKARTKERLHRIQGYKFKHKHKI